LVSLKDSLQVGAPKLGKNWCQMCGKVPPTQGSGRPRDPCRDRPLHIFLLDKVLPA